jgi:nitrogen regulatory protein PII
MKEIEAIICGIDSLPKLKMKLVVLDEGVNHLLSAIARSGWTGEKGKGKLSVIPIEDTVRVRTGEGGDNGI